jgi:hypothetical protein
LAFFSERRRRRRTNKRERKERKPIGRFDVVKNNEKRWTALLLVPFFSSPLNGNIYHIYI